MKTRAAYRSLTAVVMMSVVASKAAAALLPIVNPGFDATVNGVGFIYGEPGQEVFYFDGNPMPDRTFTNDGDISGDANPFDAIPGDNISGLGDSAQSDDGQMWHHPRTTFAIHLYPYMEQAAIYNQYNFKVASGAGQAIWHETINSSSLKAPTAQMVPTFQCPSDDGVQLITLTVIGPNTTSYQSTSNYLGFFGVDNVQRLKFELSFPHVIDPTGRPFGGRRAAFGLNFGAKLSQFEDGTSNTMVVGEYLRASSSGSNPTNDLRGQIFADQPGYSQLYAKYTPNPSNQDIIYREYCNSVPEQNLSCIDSDRGNTDSVASRSRHPGGVMVAHGDGSARLASDNVDFAVWQALTTIAGAETLSDLGS